MAGKTKKLNTKKKKKKKQQNCTKLGTSNKSTTGNSHIKMKIKSRKRDNKYNQQSADDKYRWTK